MSAIRIIKGEYRNKPVRNIAFTLVSGFASGAKGNYVTVKNDGNFPNCPDTVRVKVDSIQDFEYVTGDAVQDNTVHFEKPAVAETDDEAMDRILYGGMSRGELNIFAGGSGSGKSLVMMNIALNWLQAGMSGVYITLELSEELTSLRTDAMLTQMGTKSIRKDIDTTDLKVKMVGKKSGKYRVKGLPDPNCNCKVVGFKNLVVNLRCTCLVCKI